MALWMYKFTSVFQLLFFLLSHNEGLQSTFNIHLVSQAAINNINNMNGGQ